LPAALPVRGLATSALETVLLALGEQGGGFWGLSTIGAILIVLGFVLCAPALIAVLEPLATRSRGVVRLAARDIARQRARTGPLVAAILAVASLALLGWSFVSAERPASAIRGTWESDPTTCCSAHRSARLATPADRRARTAARAYAPSSPRNRDPIGYHVADGMSEGAAVRPLHRSEQPLQRDDESFDVAIGGQLLALGATAGRAAFDRGEVVALTPGLIETGTSGSRSPDGTAGAAGRSHPSRGHHPRRHRHRRRADALRRPMARHGDRAARPIGRRAAGAWLLTRPARWSPPPTWAD
jgi:hypothetical protein